jgi:hypothetical protein
VLIHSDIIGEIALGSLRNRVGIIEDLTALPHAEQANDDEVLALINAAPLHGLGVGYFDAHLLAATRLTPGASLWTRDKRLRAAAERLGLATYLD